MRAEQIAELPLDHIPNDDFPKALRAPKREKRILMPMPANDEPMKKARLPSGLPPYLASLYEVPLAQPRPGGPSLPQDELPQVQGVASCGRSSIPASPSRR